MERKYLNFILLKSLLVIFALIIPFTITAQKHDPEKLKQFESMEGFTGKWGFAPKFYYKIAHAKYSGSTGGLFGGFNVMKSGQGWVNTYRLAQFGEEEITKGYIQNQLDTLAPILVEETLRSAERMADLAWIEYKPIIKDLRNKVKYFIDEIQQRGGAEYGWYANHLIEDRDLLEEEIKYVHSTGPKKQIEQAKRELCYDEVKQKYEDLAKRSANILGIVVSFKTNHK